MRKSKASHIPAGLYVSGLQSSDTTRDTNLGLRPRLVWAGPSALAVDRLMHFVTALEHDVVIEIRPRAGAKGEGRVRVVGAA